MASRMDKTILDADIQAPEIGSEAELYANALDDCLARHGSPRQKRQRLLSLIDTFHDHAASKVEQLRPPRRRAHVDTEMDLDDTEDEPKTEVGGLEKRKWTLETQTWDLVRRLVPLRYPEGDSQPQRHLRQTERQSNSDNLWEMFVAQGGLVAERKKILEWLQHSASDGPDIDELVQHLQQSAERGEIIAHGWIHTRTAIKLHKDLVGASRPLDPQAPDVVRSLRTSSQTALVSHLDPDAVTRQSRKLQPQDEYFERAIWVGCFELLRRGCSLDQIRDWCTERTEVWRAVSMSALPLSARDETAYGHQQAKSLALWRRMCFATARHGGTDEVERAVYGILSGDIPSVEKVCKTWDDYLFMHYNSLLRSQFDNYVLSQCPTQVSANLDQTFAVFDAVQYHGDPATAEKRLLKSLASNSLISKEASEPTKALQAAIISNEASHHFHEQGTVLAEKRREPCVSQEAVDVVFDKYFGARDFDGLRMAVHILIVLSSLEKASPSHSQPPVLSLDASIRGVQEYAIESYVALLRLAGLEELVPLYCSRLLVPRAYEVLSDNVRQITDRDARETQLALIHKAGMDVPRFVRVQSQRMLQAVRGNGELNSVQNKAFSIMHSSSTARKFGRIIKSDFFGEDPDIIESNDEHLIRAIEWLLLVEEAWADVFMFGVEAYKYFLGNLRLNAARQLANRVPLCHIMRLRLSGGMDEYDSSWVPENDDEFWAEQLGSSKHIQMSPTQLANQARIFRDLECLVKALDSMETIASLMELSREDPSTKRDFWSQVASEVKTTRDSVEPLLHNWLLSAGAGDECLQSIRETYLPETLLAYVSALHFAGTSLSRDHLLECMDLAAIIADKDSDVAACFVKSKRMRELVESFAACSKALAIMTAEKKPSSSNSKKMREIGWSRDLWSVRS